MRTLLLPAAVAAVLAAGCRDGNDPSQAAASTGASAPIPPSLAGNHGCNGADQVFGSFQPVDVSAALGMLADPVASLTRIAGAGDGELLYATATYVAGGTTVVELDFSGGPAPAVRDLLGPGLVDGVLPAGAPAPARLGGLAVSDLATVLAIEETARFVVAVDRAATPPGVVPYAGQGATTPGFVDGLALQARFDFDAESQLCPTSDGRLFMLDTGNDALRVLFGNPKLDPAGSIVQTLAGGQSGFRDDVLSEALFDAPTGIVVDCMDRLIVTERGDGGEGNRVRAVTVGEPNFLTGQIDGEVVTLVGDGTPASVPDVGTQAQVAMPSAPVASSEGDVYWVDGMTGTLRRLDTDTGAVDCPLSSGCTTSPLTPGASHSLAITLSGTLYALEADTAVLQRVDP